MIIFHVSLPDRESPQVSRTLLSIMADLNNAVVWISFRPLFSECFCLLSRPLENVPSAPIIICITVTRMSDSFLSPLAMFKYFSLFSFSLIFAAYFQTAGVVEYTDYISREGQGSPNVCPMSQSAEAVEYTNCISHYPGRILACVYLFVYMVKFHFLA